MVSRRIIDGDGHIIEDVQSLAKFVPSFRQTGSSNRTLFPPLDHLHAQGHGSAEGSFRRVGPGDWVEFMDEVGIEAAVLYPTAGLAVGQIKNRDWAVTMCRAYNDWLADTYMRATTRLKGVALLPLQEPEAAQAELRRAVLELGMPGALLPSAGLTGHLGSPEYWPVYQAADRLGCALAVHGGCHNNLGLDELNAFVPVHALGHPFGLMVSFAALVFNKAFDRFPNVRWGFLEGGVGWIPFVLERFNRSYETFFDHNPSGDILSLPEGERVSDYVRRHVESGRIFVGCEGKESTLLGTVEAVGSSCLLFSSDFPHEVSSEYCRHEIDELLAEERLTDADKEAILHGNAERFYGG